MRVLVIKTSSMGDVIHTLPALTDAGRHLPDIRFDWVVEEPFAEIPRWHPLVDRVIPVAIRRWRKNIFAKSTRQEWQQLRKTLQAVKYDLVIDAQGLVKSAWITRLVKNTPTCGTHWRSAREALAALFYQKTYPVVWEQHAIGRVRSLFSQALNYPLPTTVPEYGMKREAFPRADHEPPYLVFLHGTTWPTKHWPEAYWVALIQLATTHGLNVKLPWGNAEELARAERMAANNARVTVLPRLNLMSVAQVLAGAQAIVAVDTGLGHLAAALDVPTVSLYGPTNPILTGALGQSQVHLTAAFPCAPCLSRTCTYRDAQPSLPNPPCFSTLAPERVWQELTMLCG